jgi:hypothetical protein
MIYPAITAYYKNNVTENGRVEYIIMSSFSKGNFLKMHIVELALEHYTVARPQNYCLPIFAVLYLVTIRRRG